jgi:flagellar biosynthesis GTPase FlhF
MLNATFDLERLEAGDGALVISGHWAAVRGMRFVRPTLTVGTRRLLATLEHKPWAPDGSEPWVAAFPWTGDEVDAAECWLDVAPGVLVPLAPGAERAPEVDEVAAQRLRFERRETEVEFLRTELRRVTSERDRVLAQRDEAVRDREAAMRTRERMQAQHDEAVASAERARAAVAKADAERDDARHQREEARAQRDEAAAGYRTLQDQLRAARAREAAPPPPAPYADDKPIGVRAIPAARAEGVRRRPEYQLTTFDLYAFRIVGAVAAACFVVLLIALLRVFI